MAWRGVAGRELESLVRGTERGIWSCVRSRRGGEGGRYGAKRGVGRTETEAEAEAEV